METSMNQTALPDPDHVTDEDYGDAVVDMQPETIRSSSELLASTFQSFDRIFGDGKCRDAEREQASGGSLYVTMTAGGGR
jgi:hypothetical protein